MGSKGLRSRARVGRPRRAPAARPVSVMILTPGLTFGGAESFVLSLVQHLPRDQIRWAAVIALNDFDLQSPIVQRITEFAPVMNQRTGIREMASACDVVLSFGVTSPFSFVPPVTRAALVSTGSCAPTAGTMADSRMAEGIGALSTFSMRATVPQSEAWRAEILPVCPSERGNTPSSKREAVRASWGISPGERVLAFIGRLVPAKRPESVATAVAALHKAGRREWRGVLTGPAAPAYAREVAAHANAVAPGLIRIFGSTIDVPGVLAGADHFILPSDAEGAPITMVEAWLARRPVLATPTGLSTIDHPRLVRTIPFRPEGDVMAAAIIADLEDPSETAARVEEAHRIASTWYSPVSFAARWAHFLKRTATAPLLRTRGARPATF